MKILVRQADFWPLKWECVCVCGGGGEFFGLPTKFVSCRRKQMDNQDWNEQEEEGKLSNYFS
jgi:hypothetical protein